MIRRTTARLLIRDHVPEDLPTHHSLFSDERIMRYLPDLRTGSLPASEANLRMAIEQIDAAERMHFFLRIEEKATGAHIGEIGYTVKAVTPVGRFVDLGYFIRDAFWGRGYTAEAAREVIRFAFEEGGVFRISTGCLKENSGSERVMQKCGMIKEGELKAYTWHGGQAKDRVVYRLLRDEWKGAGQHDLIQPEGSPSPE